MPRPRLPADRWFWLILLLALAARAYHIAYPPWDYHSWRQNITLMVARDYARSGLHLLDPRVSWVPGDQPAAPSRFTAEFPVECILTAVLYRLFGEADAVARLVTIAFSLVGIYGLYSILDRRAGPLAARFGALVYAILPYHIFFGRVLMPDVPALSLAVAALDALDRWTDDRKPARLVSAAVLTALAILQKLTVAFVLLPALYLFHTAVGGKLWRRREVYVFGLIAGAPALAWYGHDFALANRSAFTMERGLFLSHMGLWLQPRFIFDVIRWLTIEAFSPLGLVLAVCGLFWPYRGRAASLFRCWIAGAVLLLMSMPGVLPGNHYYLSLLLPGGAALAGLFLQRLAAKPALSQAVPLLLLAYTAGALSSALPFYDADRSPYHLGELLGQLTRPDELLATESGGNPNVLYAAGRRGWLLFRDFSPLRLERLARLGARYYADAFVNDRLEQREFFEKLDARFERLTADDSPWPIYSLSPAQPARFQGLAVRRLLAFPSSFEVTSRRRCPAPVVLQVADSAGKVVYTAHYPVPRCEQAGNAVQRNVLVLPVTVPAGKYRVRVSPEGPGPEDGPEEKEIAVPPPPRFGWLSPN